jgi:prolyl 4-hydroxylase
MISLIFLSRCFALLIVAAVLYSVSVMDKAKNRRVGNVTAIALTSSPYIQTTDNKDNTCMTIDEYGTAVGIDTDTRECIVPAKSKAGNAATDSDNLNHDNKVDDEDQQKENIRLGSDIGVVQNIGEGQYKDQILELIQKTQRYVNEQVNTESKFDNVRNRCRNMHESCTYWSLIGECNKNSDYMNTQCAPACQSCHPLHVEASYPLNHEDNITLGSDIGIIQSIHDDQYKDKILILIEKTRRYIEEQVHVESQNDKVRNLCRNKHTSCTYWSLLGECDTNPDYMQKQCAPVCHSCDQLHVETRCLINESIAKVFEHPNDLNDFYERIVNDKYYQTQYNVTVLSRPYYAIGDGPKTNVTYRVNGIWVVQFDNIVHETEAQRLIELGKEEGYERSADVGIEKEDGTYDRSIHDRRTSSNAWCISDICFNDTVSHHVRDRIENITNISRMNYESFQILQYVANQYYLEHNDFIDYQIDRQSGSRILTFYIYLNTIPEHGGGGTNFPLLNITVQPKLGRAILWPSIHNHAPMRKDMLSNHQALPVLDGYVKYGINAWIHQRDYQTALKIGCT